MVTLSLLLQGPESSADSASSDSGWDAVESPCDIGLLERLIRSHPVWFLPGIQRAGAFHLLQGKEEGNFVVRQSSQAATMAISVRLPASKGPYIEHYLVQADDAGRLGLESSENRFDSIPQLIAHYCQCWWVPLLWNDERRDLHTLTSLRVAVWRPPPFPVALNLKCPWLFVCSDELPVQLTLPRAIRDARNRQQLTSLALLGQEFWRYPMANPRTPDQTTPGNAADSQGVTIRSSGSGSSSLSSLGSGQSLTVQLGLDARR